MSTPRWHLRFDNYCRTLSLLEEAVAMMGNKDFTDLMKAGTVQRFEICWELGWKCLRDYLHEAGNPVEVPTVVNVIRTAFETNLIADGDAWIRAMKARNTMAHVYDLKAYEATADDVRDHYVLLLRGLRDRLKAERAAGN
jgi:nucleotidyltransferase substrate binding protein (TIGR01987 family)